MKQVIVTGGRDYEDAAMVYDVLEFINPDVVIQGGASGADRLAREWGERKGKKVFTYEAKWTEHGRAAGPIRNGVMLGAYPAAMVIAFPGGNGTADCVKQALALNRLVLESVE